MKKILFLLILISNSLHGQWSIVGSPVTANLQALSVPSSDVAYIMSERYFVYRTLNGGNSIDSLSSLYIDGNAYRNDIFFVNDSVGFAAFHGNFGNSQIHRTTDMGSTWTNLTPFGYRPGLLLVDFPSIQTGYMYTSTSFDDTLWFSQDTGSTWSSVILGFTLGSATTTTQSMIFVNDSTGYLAGADGTFAYKGVIARTENYGQSWTLTTLPQSYSLLNSIHFANPDTGYAISRDGGVYRTVDAGTSWDSIATVNVPGLSNIRFVNGMTGFIISGPDIFKSTDAGITWSLNYLDPDSNELHAICFADSMTGYVVGSNGRILKTTNAGGTVGIDPVDRSVKINVYPNPVESSLFILYDSNQKLRIIISNSIGAIVKQSDINSGTQINMSELPTGIYYYLITEGVECIDRGKFVKLR